MQKAAAPGIADMAASGRWDKTLDQNLNGLESRKQQPDRKQRFASLLEQIANGA
jgi:hypothetical protein